MPTIRDVARQAGVSIATVSRVFNGSPRVSEDTERRVWEVASTLDYWPHSAARSLSTRRTHVLGVLLPDLYGEFFSEVIRGIDHGARRGRFQVLISSSHADADEVKIAARSMRGRIDGLILMASDDGTAEETASIARRFPTVLLNPHRPIEGCSTVTIANYEGARAVVEHLIGLGHRRIAVIRGPAGNADADRRLRGWRDALHDVGIEADPALEIPGSFTESSGFRAAARLLALSPRPTAVFAANDSMAIGLLSAFDGVGVLVPGDIAVAGFDDIAIARYVRPPLTTVHADAFGLGLRAVQLLISSVEAPEPARCRQEALPVTVMVRQSCGSTSPSSRPVPMVMGDGAPPDSKLSESPISEGRRPR